MVLRYHCNIELSIYFYVNVTWLYTRCQCLQFILIPVRQYWEVISYLLFSRCFYGSSNIYSFPAKHKLQYFEIGLKDFYIRFIFEDIRKLVLLLLGLYLLLVKFNTNITISLRTLSQLCSSLEITLFSLVLAVTCWFANFGASTRKLSFMEGWKSFRWKIKILCRIFFFWFYFLWLILFVVLFHLLSFNFLHSLDFIGSKRFFYSANFILARLTRFIVVWLKVWFMNFHSTKAIGCAINFSLVGYLCFLDVFN